MCELARLGTGALAARLGVVSHELRSEPLDCPALSHSFIPNPIVKPRRPLLPKFYRIGSQQITSPIRRQRDIAVAEFLGEPSKSILERFTALDDLALIGSPCP
jgi:hypothetical protein